MLVKNFYEISEEWVNFVILNRNPNIVHPTHSYDIVEGPIANDWVTYQIKRHQEGEFPVDVLIEKLKYREETHQICFCTSESLLALRPVKDKNRFIREDIESSIIVALQDDFSMKYTDARHKLFHSDVFFQLSNFESKLCEQPWRQIYELLKKELNQSNRRNGQSNTL
jgi:hypothetical protein